MSDFDIKINKITNANPYEKQQQIVSEDSYETSIFDDYCDDKINNQNDENLDYVEEKPPIYEDTYENYTPYFFLFGINQDQASEYLSGSQKKAINQLETEDLPTENAIIDIKRNGDIIISFREPNHNALVMDYNGNIKKELPVKEYYHIQILMKKVI